jgi:hypothetical protein
MQYIAQGRAKKTSHSYNLKMASFEQASITLKHQLPNTLD